VEKEMESEKKMGSRDSNSYAAYRDSRAQKYCMPRERDKQKESNVKYLNHSANAAYFDKRISEIDQRIKETEFKKKKLGVDFVPFDKKSSRRKDTGIANEGSNRSKPPETLMPPPPTSGKCKTHSTQSSFSKVQQPGSGFLKKSFREEVSPRFAAPV
jgi:hypothetical protein